MRWGRRVSHILMMIILCILILYAGVYLQVESSGEAMPMKINELFVYQAEKMYLPGLCFAEEYFHRDSEDDDRWEIVSWPAKWAMYAVPLGNYMNSIETIELQTEDMETYEKILAMQAADENEVDENGKLIEKQDGNAKAADDAKTENFISREKLNDFDYLISNFYTVDSSTSVTESLLDAKKLLGKDVRLAKETDGPKILIYHTHSQEAFKDSKKGKKSETIMGMGEYLTKILNEEYGIETMHHEGVYDLIDGKLDRSKAYQLAEPQIKKILKEYPSIEVVIDLHRDGVKESTHLVTEIDGKKTAQIMFFNGMSRTRANGDIGYLSNPYIEDNLAVSLQLQLEAMERYPGFARRIYLKSYRYNMHLLPKSLLIEAGAQTNSVAEMKHAMQLLAEILNAVLIE